MNNDLIKLTITLNPGKHAAFAAKMNSAIGPLSPEGAIGILIDQFVDAPPAVTNWIRDRLKGFDSDRPQLWSTFEQHIRDEMRREFAAEFSLAHAVREVVAKKPGAGR